MIKKEAHKIYNRYKDNYSLFQREHPGLLDDCQIEMVEKELGWDAWLLRAIDDGRVKIPKDKCVQERQMEILPAGKTKKSENRKVIYPYLWVNQSLTIGIMSGEDFVKFVDKKEYELDNVNTADLFSNEHFIAWNSWAYDKKLFEWACQIAEAMDSPPVEVLIPSNKRGPMFFEIFCGKFENQKTQPRVYLALAETTIQLNGRIPNHVTRIYGG